MKCCLLHCNASALVSAAELESVGSKQGITECVASVQHLSSYVYLEPERHKELDTTQDLEEEMDDISCVRAID